jgi:hypothetical protein
MSIASAVCNSFKTEVLQALHNFTASSGNDFKLALYTSSANLSKSTTAYATNPGGGSNTEISNTSGSAYSAGGIALTSVTPALSTDTACCDFADVSFTSASFTANGCLIYNDSNADRAVCSIAFGGDKTVSSGTFTIQFPAADANNAILRIA